MRELMGVVIDLHQMARLVDLHLDQGGDLPKDFRRLADNLAEAIERKRGRLPQ